MENIEDKMKGNNVVVLKNMEEVTQFFEENIGYEESIGYEDEYEDDYEDDYEDLNKYSQWIENKGDYTAALDVTVVKKMKAGVYKLVVRNSQLDCVHQTLSSDGLCMLPDSTSSFILDEVKKFWESAETFKKFDMLHKRGILLEGSPGTGRRL